MRNFPVAVAEKEGAIFAFCNLWLGGDGSELSVDLMRYGKDAPRDIMTWLFLEVMLWGQGARLPLVPPRHGSALEPRPRQPRYSSGLGGFIYEHGEHFLQLQRAAPVQGKIQPRMAPPLPRLQDTFVSPRSYRSSCASSRRSAARAAAAERDGGDAKIWNGNMNCYFDRSLVAQYKSVSQKIRVMTEAWVTENITCPRCWGSRLAHLPQNTPLGRFLMSFVRQSVRTEKASAAKSDVKSSAAHTINVSNV